MPSRSSPDHPDRCPAACNLSTRRKMEEEEGDQEAFQSGRSSLISGATMRRDQPVLSPTSINLCRAYHERERSRASQNVDYEQEDDEEDVDYEEEEEEEDDDEEEEEEEEEEYAEEEEGVEGVDMGSFSEPGRRFLSKVWKEYEPIRVDDIVVAAECKHCTRQICAQRKHGTSSLRKHLRRCKERKKVLRVSGQLSASIMSPDGVAMGLWTFNQALARRGGADISCRVETKNSPYRHAREEEEEEEEEEAMVRKTPKRGVPSSAEYELGTSKLRQVP